MELLLGQLINDGAIGTIQNTSIQFKIQDVFQKLEFKYFILSKYINTFYLIKTEHTIQNKHNI